MSDRRRSLWRMSRQAEPAIRYTRWIVTSILILFVVDFAAPNSAKPWCLGAIAVGVVVLLISLGVWWAHGASAQRALLPLTGVFAVGLLASMLYLRSLPDAAIPLAGVGAMVVCLAGLAVTGLSLRSR